MRIRREYPAGRALGGAWAAVILVVAVGNTPADRAWAEPIAVRFVESPTYALLALSSATGQLLADGELIQKRTAHGAIESRLTFRFKNGAISDETVVFSQNKVFRVLAYRLIQRGPAFPSEIDAAFDRASGHYRVRYKEGAGAAEERLDGQTEMPADLYNGLGATLIRNLSDGRGEGHLLAFTPKPRLLRVEYIPSGEEPFRVGGVTRTARRYLMKLEVPGIAGVLATVVGKDPPAVNYWVARPIPAFLKFEGPMFLHGPVWRIEPTRASWTK